MLTSPAKPIRRSATACLSTLFAALLAGCSVSGDNSNGGHGGNGDNGGGATPSGFNDWHLDSVNARPYRNSEGVDGSGELIGVVDTGLEENHDVFRNTDIHPDSGDTWRGGSDFSPHSFHGTWVASIAAGEGIGVAPGADLLISRASISESDDRMPASAVAAGIDAAADNNAAAVNLSLGFDSRSLTVEDAMARATDANTAVVVSAGNDADGGLSSPADRVDDPRFGGAAVAVGAYNEDGEQFFGQANGLEHYIMAPGVFVDGADSQDLSDYVTASGTSASAPIVSGAIALVREAHPHLSAGDAIDVLLDSADDSFNGYDPQDHGAGHLDLDAAAAPLGGFRVATDSDPYSDEHSDVEATAMRMGPAFGDALSHGLDGVLGVDDYGRGFYFDLSDRIDDRSAARGAEQRLIAHLDRISSQHNEFRGTGPIAGAEGRFLQSYYGERADGVLTFNHGAIGNTFLQGTTSQGIIDGHGRFEALNDLPFYSDVQSAHGERTEGSQAEGRIGFQGPQGGVVAAHAGRAIVHRQASSPAKDGAVVDRFGASYARVFAGRTEIRLGYERVIHDASLWGVQGTGALSPNNGAQSDQFHLEIRSRLGGGLEAFLGTERHFSSQEATERGSVLEGMSDIEADRHFAGFALLPMDRVSIGAMVSQPVRVRGGTMDLDVAVDQNDDGSLVFEHREVGLEPSGRQRDSELMLGLHVESGAVTLNIVHSEQPRHVRSASSEVTYAVGGYVAF